MTFSPRHTLDRLARNAAWLLCVLCCGASGLRAQYVNFESQQTRPICLSPDGTRLFAVNTPDGRLSVFDVSNAANPVPVLIREIPVGVEPVSVNALSNEEAWVVNEVSDSVSIVSVAAGAVVATLACKDEPGDVVFANGRAFVSCSRNNLVRAFDLTTLAELAAIPLEGLNPHSLAVSGDGTKVYAAFKLSGNRTTLLLQPPLPLPQRSQLEDYPPSLPPMNPALPAPPIVHRIVPADDVRLNDPPNAPPHLPDNDVAEIATGALSVTRYFKGTGTVNFYVAVRPGSDELWIANTEARNLVRFEPALKGHAVDNRVTRVQPAGLGTVTAFDLNPGIDYALLLNNPARESALAQPTALAFTPDGAALWLASFGSDRVAKVDAATGAVTVRIETGPTTGAAADPRNKRGPRGLALHSAHQRLYVLNRLSNTITIVSTASESVVAEIPAGSFDPTPAVIRQGRGFLYDTRLSNTGTQSCASCHIDGDRDDLAWDLGDPGGAMQIISNPFGAPFNMHPMKGPMTTQTLRGLSGIAPQHWRGDRANFAAFNPAFASLLGGAQLSSTDMTAFGSFINTITFEPNPNQNLDRTLPATFPPGDPNGGDPNAGLFTFRNENYQPSLQCDTCHLDLKGASSQIIPASALQQSQDFKVPHLRNVYQKLHFKRSATLVSLSGFGLVHDGQDPDLIAFFSHPVFGTFATDTTRKRNLNAFVQCFDTGTAPSVGYTRTVQAATLAASAATWTLLETQANAASGNSDLVVRLVDASGRHGFVYRPATNDYLSDRAGLGPLTRAGLEALISGGATATLMGVPRASGQRLGVDRNGNAVLDGDEPLPALGLAFAASTPQLAWPTAHPALVLEFTDALIPANWQPVTEPRTPAGAMLNVLDPTAGAQRFYRLRQP